jgi:hypothetical protein
MSFTPYSARLVPERGLRLLVLSAGTVTTVVGVCVIAGLGLAPVSRLFAAALWLISSLRELWLMGRAQRRFRAVRMYPGGRAELSCRQGGRVGASLLAGSVVLPRLAWLRFRTEDGWRHAELLRRNAGRGEQWRRLQVLARHLGGTR